MKKTALFGLVVIFLFFPAKVVAQTFDANKAYADYQYQLSIYQEDYSNFQEAKTFYLANPTLQLKEDARQKTLKMLKDRDQLMIVYLTALRIQIVETTGFDDSQKGAIFGKIDSEVDWYKIHIPNYKDSDELVDLFNKADEGRSRNETNTTPIVDEALFDIGLSKEIGIRKDHEQIYSDLKNYINDQVAKGTLKIDPFNRWLNDTDAVLQLLKKNEASGATKIQTIYTQNFGTASTYNEAIQILSASLSPLSQLNNYLTEMLNSIQNQIK
ncbi:MAG TPA: hypothetical protein VKC53_00750 [Patescibacteria group bacterium]|nr:hypothetical protein [Patescibacteria group bacterium]